MVEIKRIVIDNKDTDYLIYSDGRVYSEKTNRFLKPRNCAGYLRVAIYTNDRIYQMSIHRLVATAFIENPKNKPEVNHKDGNKTNNSVQNLEWVTTSENVSHAFKTELKFAKHGNESHLSKYSIEQVRKACEYMEEGEMTLTEISDITLIDYAMVYLIATHKAWINVSCEYKIDNHRKGRVYYTYDQYRTVFYMLNQNYYSAYEISDRTGVSYSAIMNVLSRKNNPIYNSLYDEIDISGYSGGIKPYKSITKEIKQEIQSMYESGITRIDIVCMVSSKYSINYDKVKKFVFKNYK